MNRRSKERPKNNFPTLEGDSPIFAPRKSGQSPSCSSAGPRSIVVAAAAAMVLASVLLVGAQRSDAGKPQPTTEFTIETNQTQGMWYDWGRFSASGAFKDNGEALTYFSNQLGLVVMELTGKDGNLDLSLWRDADGSRYFTIIDGSGDYVDLVGISGPALVEWQYKPNGTVKVYHTLTGSVAL